MSGYNYGIRSAVVNKNGEGSTGFFEYNFKLALNTTFPIFFHQKTAKRSGQVKANLLPYTTDTVFVQLELF